ncbi:MAG: bifunctional DNA primase/polymerase [Proteobacteria bacterium]|nr:bifunctional DNA primase/polymerase [Pseudomonadota bacterium]
MDYLELYGSLGWRVFPLKPGTKIPATPNGWKDATNDPSVISRLPDMYPRHNVGIVCGGGGPVVVDIERDGLRGWAKLTATYGEPRTAIVLTGGGGRHYYFQDDPEIKRRIKVLPGVDFLGAGGYAVAPPSVTKRVYSWIGNPAELAIMPAWLRDFYSRHGEHQARTTTSCAGGLLSMFTGNTFILPTNLTEGERNDVLFKYGSSLRGRGFSVDEIRLKLIEANTERCSPPLPDDELEKTILKTVAKYDPEQWMKG